MIKPISVRHRWEIVFLHLDPYGPHWDIQQIRKYLHLGRQTVSHWIAVYQKAKSIEAGKSTRRKKITSSEQDAMITEFALQAPEASTKQIDFGDKENGFFLFLLSTVRSKRVVILVSNRETSAINKTHFFNTEICMLQQEL